MAGVRREGNEDFGLEKKVTGAQVERPSRFSRIQNSLPLRKPATQAILKLATYFAKMASTIVDFGKFRASYLTVSKMLN